MPPGRLHVALVWHMHQPWYRDDVAGAFVLPWVRRRAAKDYLHMLQVLERHPEMRVTVNMVPALLEQLEIYAAGDSRDADRELCLRDADELTAAERAFLVAGARHDDYGRRVGMLAPFVALCASLSEGAPAQLDVSTVRDLQVWTMLAWIDPDQLRADPDLDALVRRGRGFSESDKRVVDDRQLSLLRGVIPAYRAAVAAGRVEPMTSPYHHPILPLLLDPASARVATPGVALPEPALGAAADAAEHVRRGLESFARITGVEAVGMWPPECAVSPATAALLANNGVRFAVSDEGVLARTLETADVRAGGALYAPYRDASGLTVVFRDAELSNRVGFSYQSMPADQAAADLVRRLEEIAVTPAQSPARLVTIALDGENFKDFYDENATPFLDALYTRLLASPVLESSHIGSFLDTNPDSVRPLPPLWTGSWIDADLRTWIGGDAHGRAWDLLAATRAAVAAAGGAGAHPRAHDEVLIAESSDWFWWFGEHHDSGSDAAWHALFRAHLRNAHVLAGLDVPAAVDEPILGDLGPGGDCAPLRAIDPTSGGEPEWRSAGIAQVGAVFGAMRPPASSVSQVLYGVGDGHLHMRFGDAAPRFDRAVVDAGALGRLMLDRPTRTLSVALPPAARLDVTITLEEAGRGIERVPSVGALHLDAARASVPRPTRVAVVAAECAPLVTVGDLAARVAATAAAAAALGHDVIVVIPRHRGASPGGSPAVRITDLAATIDGRTIRARVLQGSLPGTGLPVLSIDAPGHFDRDAVYGAVDDGDRYLAFCALARAVLDATGFRPDIVHGFEWQAGGLVAALAAEPGPATVLDARASSPEYRVDAGLLTRMGAAGAGVGEVDLLEVARRAATVVDDGRSGRDLAELYRAALEHRGG
jgi:alpha-amylase/alpha-mannosidase (GH57 family)